MYISVLVTVACQSSYVWWLKGSNHNVDIESRADKGCKYLIFGKHNPNQLIGLSQFNANLAFLQLLDYHTQIIEASVI